MRHKEETNVLSNVSIVEFNGRASAFKLVLKFQWKSRNHLSLRISIESQEIRELDDKSIIVNELILGSGSWCHCHITEKSSNYLGININKEIKLLVDHWY